MHTGDFWSTEPKKKIYGGSIHEAILECLDRENLTFYKSDLEYYNDDCVSLLDVVNHLNKRIKNRLGNESGSTKMRSSNSKLCAYIDLYQVIIYANNELEFSDNDFFSLEYNVKTKTYNIKNADNNLSSLIKNHEEDVLKNIFVPILYCPDWMQYDLDHMKNKKIAQSNVKILAKQIYSFFRN